RRIADGYGREIHRLGEESGRKPDSQVRSRKDGGKLRVFLLFEEAQTRVSKLIAGRGNHRDFEATSHRSRGESAYGSRRRESERRCVVREQFGFVGARRDRTILRSQDARNGSAEEQDSDDSLVHVTIL